MVCVEKLSWKLKMQRKATKQSRGPNAKERAFQAWLKWQPCSFCHAPAPSIVDHCKGSAFKINKLMIGHMYVNSKCQDCDNVVTHGARQSLFVRHGERFTDSDATLEQMNSYEEETGVSFSDEEKAAIADVYKLNEDTTNYWMDRL